ncbi:MAG: hypothetical protein HY820_40520 [Acidobacteria bacterium]|nr:hypothetical protein [Acidobacteriota bacterium]
MTATLSAAPAAETIRAVRLALERARASHYLSDFDTSTSLLQLACEQLASLLPARWLEAMPDLEKAQLRMEMQLLSHEIARSEALHNQASGLMAGWAKVFSEATGIQPAQDYSRSGFGEMIAARSLGSNEWVSHEWEA